MQRHLSPRIALCITSLSVVHLFIALPVCTIQYFIKKWGDFSNRLCNTPPSIYIYCIVITQATIASRQPCCTRFSILTCSAISIKPWIYKEAKVCGQQQQHAQCSRTNQTSNRKHINICQKNFGLLYLKSQTYFFQVHVIRRSSARVHRRSVSMIH